MIWRFNDNEHYSELGGYMKRSEMILLMYSWMLELPDDIKNMSDGGQQMYRSMDFILSKMEEAGIKPPQTYLTNEPDYTWEEE